MVKFVVDFFPLLVFFIAFKLKGIFVATGAVMVATTIQFAYLRIKGAKISGLQIFSLVLIVCLGGGTLLFQDERFLFWKPTIANTALAVAALFSLRAGSKPATQAIFEEAMGDEVAGVPPGLWRRLTLQWVAFFLLEGVVNLVVAFNFPLNTWVYFKAFGLTVMTLVMVVLQSVQLQKSLPSTPKSPPA